MKFFTIIAVAGAALLPPACWMPFPNTANEAFAAPPDTVIITNDAGTPRTAPIEPRPARPVDPSIAPTGKDYTPAQVRKNARANARAESKRRGDVRPGEMPGSGDPIAGTKSPK